MVEGVGDLLHLQRKTVKTEPKPIFFNLEPTMANTLNISIEPELMASVAASLKNAELGRLWRALTASMGDEDEDVSPLLNNSGLQLAYALLQPFIAEAKQRLATNRANGARGGRPRKHPLPDGESSKPVSAKKSKKEALSPTPPIEEKNKKNNPITLSQPAGEGVRHPAGAVAVGRVPELEELQEQLLREQPWLDELCMSRHIDRQDMAMYVMDFIAYLRERDLRETLQHAKAHFVNQLPYIIKIYKTNHNHEKQNSKTHQEFIADPVARRQFERESRRQEVCRAIAEVAAEGQCPAVVPF